MKDHFILRFATMPKGTAQMRQFNGLTHTSYKSKSLKETERIYKAQLLPHRPEKPAEGSIRLFICLYFDIKSPKKLWGKFKATRPDVDNFCKAFVDQMTQVGFWKDDSQIVDYHVKKYYAEQASIYVEYEVLNDE